MWSGQPCASRNQVWAGRGLSWAGTVAPSASSHGHKAKAKELLCWCEDTAGYCVSAHSSLKVIEDEGKGPEDSVARASDPSTWKPNVSLTAI